jgi:small subunit ribosomal protein S6
MADSDTQATNVAQYEIAVLYDPGLEIDLDKGSDKVNKVFKEAGGKVISADNWGKKKLAYPIAKQDHAVYVFYTVELPAESVAKVEAIFNITDEIIRFLITKPDLKAIAKAEAAKEDKAKKAAERQEKSDEKSTDEE